MTLVFCCCPMYFLCSAFIPQTSPGLVLLAWDPAVLLFVIPSLLFLPVLHHIQPLCQLFFPSSFLPIPFGLSPFLVTLVHRFSRSQQTWIVCPICTLSLSDLVRRSPISGPLSVLLQLCSLGHCSRGKRVVPKHIPFVVAFHCLLQPLDLIHQEHPWCASLPLVHTHPQKSQYYEIKGLETLPLCLFAWLLIVLIACPPVCSLLSP